MRAPWQCKAPAHSEHPGHASPNSGPQLGAKAPRSSLLFRTKRGDGGRAEGLFPPWRPQWVCSLPLTEKPNACPWKTEHQTHPALTTAKGFAEDEVGNANWLLCPRGTRAALGFTTTHGGHGGPASTKNQVLHPQVLQICVLGRAAMGRSEPHTHRVERQDTNPTFQGPIILVILIPSTRNCSILHNGEDDLCSPNPGFSITFCPQEVVCFGKVTRAVRPIKSNLFSQREFCIR